MDIFNSYNNDTFLKEIVDKKRDLPKVSNSKTVFTSLNKYFEIVNAKKTNETSKTNETKKVEMKEEVKQPKEVKEETVVVEDKNEQESIQTDEENVVDNTEEVETTSTEKRDHSKIYKIKKRRK